MIFAVIWIDYKNKLLFVEGLINARRYVQNVSDLGFIEYLDHTHGVFKDLEFQYLRRLAVKAAIIAPIQAYQNRLLCKAFG
jgi:hypothetical protein